MESDSDRSPQLKGVVIITLPPPDNPSLGKTITAFTVSDSSPYQTHQEQLHNNNHQSHIPAQTQQNPHLQISFPRFRLFHGVPRKLVLFLGISIFALVLYAHVYPVVVKEFRRSNDDDDDGPKSFLFPLYPKLGIRGENNVQLKLGRVVDFDKGNIKTQFGGGIRTQKVNKLVSSAAKVDSSTIFPVRGNIYPDGYGRILLLSLLHMVSFSYTTGIDMNA